MKVALFTSFSPAGGGGAANLRSWLPRLQEIEVTWFHLGPPVPGVSGCVSLGARLLGGPLVTDVVRTPLLWGGGRAGAVRAIADSIVARGFDRHWVVAMDEGIMVGNLLARLAARTPLHVSVQDDQEFGMYARSRRYRIFSRLARRPTETLLRVARSVDVTSDGMQRYYADRLGLRSTVLHPVIDRGEIPAEGCGAGGDAGALTMGHIGAIYSGREFRLVLSALKVTAAAARRRPSAIFIGLLPKYRERVRRAGIAAEMIEWLPDGEAARTLRRSDFLYAMYPFDQKSDIFARTSLPTKLTTYIRARRTVLAHAPAASTLAETVDRSGIGVVCTENTVPALQQAIETAVSVQPAADAFEALRERNYGIDNAEKLTRLLRSGNPS